MVVCGVRGENLGLALAKHGVRLIAWGIGGAVAVSGSGVFAQITPDDSLGAESSVVIPLDAVGFPADGITGGATRGANLFHSFEEFNVAEGRGAYFFSPAGIENILSRVTGGNPSEILGTLGTFGDSNPNLFLLNPNGIIFGPNASLDLQGSFLGTTASGIAFGENSFFSALNPEVPGQLLTVNPSAFFFNAAASQGIINQSRATTSVLGNPTNGLQVPDGRSLVLLGGDIQIDGGNLNASGGRIELGSVAGVGEVSVTQSGNRFVLGYDSVSGLGNISLSDGAFVDASGEGGGDIQIRGARLEVIERSNIWADTLGMGNGGEVLLRTTEEVVLSEGSRLFADVLGSGTGGNLTIETGRLLVSDGAQVSTTTFGEGDGGQLNVNATEMELIGTNSIDGTSSGLSAQVGPNATGDGGDVTISTQSLRILEGASLSASTFGEGNAGNLTITATEGIEVSGSDPKGNSSSISAQVNPEATGNGGNLTIDTAELFLSQGGQIGVSTFGTGNGGQLNVNATEIELIGTNPIDGNSSGLSAQVGPNTTGDGGDVTISTQSLRILDGASLSAETFGDGNAGNLTITATKDIQVSGSDPEGFPSSISAQVNPEAIGNGGNLTLLTAQLLLSQGGFIAVSTFGEGDGGDVTISTQGLHILGGAFLDVSTFGEGNAGNLTITATEGIQVIGSDSEGFPSGISAAVAPDATGIGGNLNIDTGYLLLRDEAFISSSNFGNGTAGNINLTVRDTLEANNGKIRTDTTSSTGGAITIKAGDIRLFGDSDIRTDVASGVGGGGNITLRADSVIAYDDSDILAFAQDGRGGDITLNTPAFFGENFQPAPKNTNPKTLDDNDRVDVNATGAVEGNIDLPDVSAIQNGITPVKDNLINTEELIASSCIARTEQPESTFYITGTGGFAERPGDAQTSIFPLGTIRNIPSDSDTPPSRTWQEGDPIIEPQGVYRLPNGELVLSRECSE
ncbi:two-partner secretion domain-containing protein [Lyngbya aestuarii]|uniref:two-partner secretion domain-containing protein n=1 Tax=Lyngbya aestuarii TaxID=118322 RepID=UPI00403DDD42